MKPFEVRDSLGVEYTVLGRSVFSANDKFKGYTTYLLSDGKGDFRTESTKRLLDYYTHVLGKTDFKDTFKKWFTVGAAFALGYTLVTIGFLLIAVMIAYA